MRFPIRRLLVVGGGAAILATAGFAYLASNTVQPSSAGEGAGVVTGYSVTNISYSENYLAPGGATLQNAPHSITAVSFTLTEVPANATASKAAPRELQVQFETGTPAVANGPIGMLNPAHGAASCSFTGSGWSTITGSGNVFCDFSGNPILVSSVTGLDVEANQ